MRRCLCGRLTVEDGDLVVSVTTCPRCCTRALHVLNDAMSQVDLFEEGESVSVSALPELNQLEKRSNGTEIVCLDDLSF